MKKIRAQPVKKNNSNVRHRRYSLNELLEGCTAKNIQTLNNAVSWALAGICVGREIA